MKKVIFKNNTASPVYLGWPIKMNVAAGDQVELSLNFTLAQIEFCAELSAALNASYGASGCEISDGTKSAANLADAEDYIKTYDSGIALK